jgi:2-octaprenyl-6-methoxyphenol hydroxylase
MMTENCDIAIIGGGPVGAALALALRDSGLHIRVLEARTNTDASADPRALALAYGSRLLLTQLGIWPGLSQVSAIKTIHISQKNSFGRTLLKADDLKVPDLGYVLPYAALQSALQHALETSQIDYQQGAAVTQLDHNSDNAAITYLQNGKEHQLQARLVVVADGGKLLQASQLSPGHSYQTRDYGQSALITHVTCAEPRANTAFERFTPQGPLALLPYQEGYELVWTAPDTEIQSMLQWDDRTLLSQLHLHFGDRVGLFLSVGARSSFPLRLRRASTTTLPHTVLIGNAAQTLHPVAGQGFNMGLRDAWELAQVILRSSAETLGSAAMLTDYAQSRALDRNSGIRFTDSLVRLFSNDLPLLAPGRSAALSLLDSLPNVKKFVAKRMMFGVNG